MAHDKDHVLDATADHTGISGTTGNFMALNANGLPVDSTAKASDFSLTAHTHAHSTLTDDESTKHRLINDSGSGTTELWSANKISTEFDALSSGIIRKKTVIDYVDATVAPPTEVSGDRYILDDGTPVHANWDGASPLDIVDFNGTTWDAETPEEGWTAYVDAENLDRIYIDDGTPAWNQRAAAVGDHGSLTGLGDDDHTQYSLVAGTRDYTGKVSYSSHPTFSADTEIIDKKYADDLITTHESTYDHSDLHTRLHDIDATADHNGISGTTGNFMALNANGLPVDSTYSPSSFVTGPAGADTQVQFNDGGVFGADSAFVWNKTTDILNVPEIRAFAAGTLGLYDNSGVGLTIQNGGYGDFAEEIKIKVFSQAGEPTLSADHRIAFWIDTDQSNKVYLIFRRGSGDNTLVHLH